LCTTNNLYCRSSNRRNVRTIATVTEGCNLKIIFTSGVLLLAMIVLIGCGSNQSSEAISAAKERIITEGLALGEPCDFKFSDVETELYEKEDRDLKQEGSIGVTGRVSYINEGNRHYHFFRTTVRFYKDEYRAGTVSFETDYDSYEDDKSRQR